MSEERPGDELQEEPQAERGAPGSRDKGPAPGEGPADRPAEAEHTARDATGVNPQEPIDPEMANQPPGDQGG
jgi:hypothetical protein